MDNNGFKDKLITVWGLVKKYAKKVWEYIKVAKMELIVMIALFVIDLVSKSVVDSNIAQNSTVVLIPNFLNFTYVRNYDAAFGSDWMRTHLGIGARIIFCIFAVVASVVFIIILVKNRGGNKVVRIGLGMLVAGAMGNCIDRMALGYVRDFIEFVYFGGSIWGRTSFWIFNIADAALVIGVILVVIYYLILYKGKDNAAGKTDRTAVNASVDANAQTLDTNASTVPNDDNSGKSDDGVPDGEAPDSVQNSDNADNAENTENLEKAENSHEVDDTDKIESVETSTDDGAGERGEK